MAETSENLSAGVLLTFEGIEGCGKSTQIALLAERLRKLEHKVVVSREPGATRLGEHLRELLLDPNHDPDALTELLLYLADRREHCRRVIGPALKRGEIVLLDRFIDSTWVYQGFAATAAGVGAAVALENIEMLNRLVVGAYWPRLTFLLDCPAEIGLKRARQRNLETAAVGVADRFERRQLKFHEQVRAGFLHLAAVAKERFSVLDAARPPAELHNAVWQEFSRRILQLEQVE